MPARAKAIPRTARDPSAYKRQFGVIRMTEQRILDVGAGDALCAESGPHVVVRCDPSYAVDPPDQPHHAVAATGTRLPFADGTFDRVLCSWVTPHILPGELAAFLAELVRVTTPGGRILVYPLYHVVRHLVSTHEFVFEKKFVADQPGTTLVIVKDPALSATEWNVALEDLCVGARFQLSRPLTLLRDLATRRAFYASGSTRASPSVFRGDTCTTAIPAARAHHRGRPRGNRRRRVAITNLDS